MRSFTGFGGSLLMAPFLCLYIHPAQVVVILTLMNWLITLQFLPGIIKHIPWKKVLTISVPAIMTVPLGLYLGKVVDPTYIRTFMSFLVVSMSLLMLLGWTYKGTQTMPKDATAGIFSGVLNGVAGAGGPPVIFYMISKKDDDAQKTRAFFMAYFGVLLSFTLIMMFIGSTLKFDQVLQTSFLLPFYIIASFIGTYLFNSALKSKQEIVRKISLIFLLCIGIISLSL